jgi:hypothetical protein
MGPCAAAEPDGFPTACERELGRFTVVLRLDFGWACGLGLRTVRWALPELRWALPEERVGVQLARAAWTWSEFASPRWLREEVCASADDDVSKLTENAANKATQSGRGV